jgi:hypothetical protein
LNRLKPINPIESPQHHANHFSYFPLTLTH